MEARGLLEPLISFTHRTESTADGETTSSEPESSEVGSEAAFEPSIANSGLGWAPSAASLAIAMGMASDRGAGLGIRTTAGSGWTAADVVAAGSFGDVVPGTEVWPGEGHAESGPPAGDVDERTIAAVSDPAWADLLDGTLHADWETIDREICRFLSGIGGLTEHPGGWEVGRAWLAWMGAAAAMFLAHEGSHGARRFFRRAGRGAGGAAVEDPARVGPWPLGPP